MTIQIRDTKDIKQKTKVQQTLDKSRFHNRKIIKSANQKKNFCWMRKKE